MFIHRFKFIDKFSQHSSQHRNEINISNNQNAPPGEMMKFPLARHLKTLCWTT